MKPLPLCLLAAALLAFQPPLAARAEDEIRSETVQFAPGTSGTTITGRIKGRDSVAYHLGAEAGQRMVIRLDPSNGATYFTVFGPGQAPGGEGLAGSDLTGPMVPDLNLFDAVLPTSGDYTVLVYLYRSAARRDEVSDYTLEISIEGETGAVVQGDFADGLQGGPDFWAVRTSASGGKINLRASPSTGAAVLGTAANGTVLRNLGCRMAEARRWCQVATLADPGIEGWAAGEFLVESGGPDAAPAPAPDSVSVDALVPGTAFNATGEMPCTPSATAPDASCPFGVEREGNGNGWITVTLPDGTPLRLRFEDLTPVSFDPTPPWAGREMTVSQQDDQFTVFVGDTRLSFPLALMAGG